MLMSYREPVETGLLMVDGGEEEGVYVRRERRGKSVELSVGLSMLEL